MKSLKTSVYLGILSALMFLVPSPSIKTFAQDTKSEINGIFIKPAPNDPHPYFASLERGSEIVQTGNSEGKKQIYWHSLVPGTYNLKIEAPGYKTRTMCVRMLPRKRPAGVQTLSVDAKLSKGEGVEVFWKGRCLTSN